MSKYKLIVKFNHQVIQSRTNEEIKLQPSILSNQSITGYHYSPVIPYSFCEKNDDENNINFEDEMCLCYLEEASLMSLSEIEELAQQLESYDFIEYAEIESVEPISPPVELENPINVESEYFIPARDFTLDGIIFKNNETPSLPYIPFLSQYQEYKNGITNRYAGIDIEYAWSIGVTGQGIRCADIEWGFNYNHADLQRDSFIELLRTTNHSYNDHGTAVAGVLYAQNNGFGMKGMVHGADALYGISEIPHGRVAGIMLGLQKLRPGDVFLYELQTNGQGGHMVPPDYSRAVWDITKKATDAGIIVVSAAGNGAQNLDSSFYHEYRNRGDNGIIRVGAGTKIGRNRASFSTYGRMVHVQGWGDWSVASTGYSDLYNGGSNANYTARFSGTSSATPIVASAVIAIQSWYKKKTNKVLTPVQMRNLLIETGTPQGSGGHIGPLPNVRKAITSLNSRL